MESAFLQTLEENYPHIASRNKLTYKGIRSEFSRVIKQEPTVLLKTQTIKAFLDVITERFGLNSMIFHLVYEPLIRSEFNELDENMSDAFLSFSNSNEPINIDAKEVFNQNDSSESNSKKYWETVIGKSADFYQKHKDSLVDDDSMNDPLIKKAIGRAHIKDIDKRLYLFAENLLEIKIGLDLRRWLEGELNKLNDEENQTENNIQPETLPDGWYRIETAKSYEDLKKFSTFLFKETNNDKRENPFLSEAKTKEIFKYGLAYPINPSSSFSYYSLNLDSPRNSKIIMYCFHKFYGEFGVSKKDTVKFLKSRFKNYKDSQFDSIYNNMSGTKPKSMKFDIDRYL